MTAALPERLTIGALRANGVSPHALRGLLEQGAYRRIAPGVFLREGVTDDTTAAWVAAATKKPQSTICLLSAAALHELTDEIPRATDLALPRGVLPPRVLASAVTWHRFDPATFHVGREDHPLPGGLCIGLYSAERTIIDLFRLRHTWGADLAITALKRWLHRPGRDPAGLLALASDFPQAKPALRSALEILL